MNSFPVMGYSIGHICPIIKRCGASCQRMGSIPEKSGLQNRGQNTDSAKILEHIIYGLFFLYTWAPWLTRTYLSFAHRKLCSDPDFRALIENCVLTPIFAPVPGYFFLQNETPVDDLLFPRPDKGFSATWIAKCMGFVMQQKPWTRWPSRSTPCWISQYR
jgi:hypothetical protein